VHDVNTIRSLLYLVYTEVKWPESCRKKRCNNK